MPYLSAEVLFSIIFASMGASSRAHRWNILMHIHRVSMIYTFQCKLSILRSYLASIAQKYKGMGTMYPSILSFPHLTSSGQVIKAGHPYLSTNV